MKKEQPLSHAEQARVVKAAIEIARRIANAPALDNRPANEILGYGENGIPT